MLPVCCPWPVWIEDSCKESLIRSPWCLVYRVIELNDVCNRCQLLCLRTFGPLNNNGRSSEHSFLINIISWAVFMRLSITIRKLTLLSGLYYWPCGFSFMEMNMQDKVRGRYVKYRTKQIISSTSSVINWFCLQHTVWFLFSKLPPNFWGV